MAVAEPALLAALRQARVAAEHHMRDMVAQGNDRWHEQTVTDLLCTTAHPTLRCVPFNPRQERVVGADWLWWWLDRSGECFGLLLQAKNLCRTGAGWSIDFGYRRGEQMRSLFEAAHVLQVPAGYILYCGDSAYRANMTCIWAHDLEACKARKRAAVTLITALMARYLVGREIGQPSLAAIAAFHHSVPIEDLVDPRVQHGPMLDVNLQYLDPSLKEFLLPLDLDGLCEFVPHVLWRLPRRPYSALVPGPDSFDALVWFRPHEVTRLDAMVVGDTVRLPSGLSYDRATREPA